MEKQESDTALKFVPVSAIAIRRDSSSIITSMPGSTGRSTSGSGGLAGIARFCRSLGIIGVGVMEAGAQFKRPLRDGDLLSLGVSIEDWGRKTLRLAYGGRADGEIALVGTELRGLFKLGDGAIVVAEAGMLREIVDEDGQDQ
jgi:4-hydroxybenzoyl-CoA thioesterase